jgi:large subunit ribosomal protein L1
VIKQNLTKRQRAIHEKLTVDKVYPIDEALKLSIEFSNVKFLESVDVAINLGVDPKKSDQVVRARTVLPNGTGRTGRRIAVFARGDAADAAKAAGATIVGFEELADQVKQDGKLDCDIVIATPEAMKIVGTLGQILGPRGLMPNPKEGTVTNDVTTAIKNVTNGVRIRTDKNGIIHCPIGTVKMDVNALKANLHSIVVDLKKLKPATSKGAYIKRITISTTMGPGLMVDIGSVEA